MEIFLAIYLLGAAFSFYMGYRFDRKFHRFLNLKFGHNEPYKIQPMFIVVNALSAVFGPLGVFIVLAADAHWFANQEKRFIPPFKWWGDYEEENDRHYL